MPSRTRGIRSIIKYAIPSALVRFHGPKRPGRLALTFDDGPRPGVTDEVVKQLAARGHRATFFILGERAAHNRPLLEAVVANGCELGNHTYSHKKVDTVPSAELVSEIGRTESLIAAVQQGTRTWFRPPEGRLSPRLFPVLWRSATTRATPLLWSLSVPFEHRIPPRQAIEVLKAADPQAGDIVLLHDDNEHMPELLPSVLDLLEEKGLHSVTVSELTA